MSREINRRVLDYVSAIYYSFISGGRQTWTIKAPAVTIVREYADVLAILLYDKKRETW